MLKESLAAIAMAVSLAWLTGCASVPKMSPEADAEAERFEPEAGTGSLYVVRDAADRDWAVLGLAKQPHEIPVSVLIDGNEQGRIDDGTYFLFKLAPGAHNVAVAAVGNFDSVRIEVREGGTHFVKVDVDRRTHGDVWVAVAWVKEIDADEGRSLVVDGERVRPTPES